MNARTLPFTHHGFSLPTRSRRTGTHVAEILAVVLALGVWIGGYCVACPSEPVRHHVLMAGVR